jgi:hypothetical protein
MSKRWKAIAACAVLLSGLIGLRVFAQFPGEPFGEERSPRIFYQTTAPRSVPPGSIWLVSSNVWLGTNFIDGTRYSVTNAGGSNMLVTMVITNLVVTNMASVLPTNVIRIAGLAGAGGTNAITNVWFTLGLQHITTP